MQQTKTPVSKIRMALMWLLLVGLTVFWIVFLLWRHRDRPLAPGEENPDLVTSIIMGMVAGVFLIAGLGGYFIFLVTNGFTFNFTQPVWSSMKSKLYLANVVVLTGTALGFGFGLAPFVNPWLVSLGMSGQTVRLLPVMALIVLLQLVRIFVLISAPFERRLIGRRLLARGISPAQL